MKQIDLLKTHTCFRCGTKYQSYMTYSKEEDKICNGKNCFKKHIKKLKNDISKKI